MHMNVDQNTTIQNLMSAVQKERDVHPAWQQPTYLGKNLLTMPLNTKLVTLNFDAHPNTTTTIMIHSRHPDVYHLPTYSVLLENYADFLVALNKDNLGFKIAIEAFNQAVTNERNDKMAQLPSKDNYLKAHPNASVDDYVAYTKTEALKKEYDSLCTPEFMEPSATLKAMKDNLYKGETLHIALWGAKINSANAANSKK